MVPLLAVGLAAVFLILRKALQFMKLRPEAPGAIGKIAALARAGDIDNAKAEALAIGAPLGEILAEGLELRDSPREHVEEIMHERLLASAPAIERGLGALAVCAGVAPLLGLLGTVTGMIHTFQLVRVFGTGEARLLASGISEALVTTEAGLAIAIPVLIVHAYFARKTRATISAMEQGIIAFADRLKRDIHD